VVAAQLSPGPPPSTASAVRSVLTGRLLSRSRYHGQVVAATVTPLAARGPAARAARAGAARAGRAVVAATPLAARGPAARAARVKLWRST
jgi:hypothetical protein